MLANTRGSMVEIGMTSLVTCSDDVMKRAARAHDDACRAPCVRLNPKAHDDVRVGVTNWDFR